MPDSRNRILVASILVLCAGVATAWQSALSSVGWTEAQVSEIAERFFTNSSPNALPNNGYLSREVKQRWIGRAPAERAQAVRELARYARSYVQTPAFEKLYNGWIEKRYQAVNHGIKAEKAPATQADSNAMMSQAAAEMVKSMGELPPEAMQMLLKGDIDMLQKKTGERDKKMLARYREVESLLKTSPAEGRKRYAIVKTMQMTGQDNEATLNANLAAGAKSAAEAKRMEEQRAWDQHNLKAELRRRLTEFVALAGSVDFAAQTQPRAGRQTFVNPDFERKPNSWKALFRLGKEPAMAAADAAKQWLREL